MCRTANTNYYFTMHKTFALVLSTIFLLAFLANAFAQDEARAIWQVTKFDVTASIQQSQRLLTASAVIIATNVGRGTGASFTFRINSNAWITTVTVGCANASFRTVPEGSTNLQRVTVTLPGPIAPNAPLIVTVGYTLPVEGNTGLTAISPIGSQFLPLSFWYPSPSMPYTSRGPDRAPFKLSISGAGAISSGIEKTEGAVTSYENRSEEHTSELQSPY